MFYQPSIYQGNMPSQHLMAAQLPQNHMMNPMDMGLDYQSLDL
jgi:hypothetical protein